MKKITIHKPGGYDRLGIEEFPNPTPGPNEVLIETQFAGVNYADIAVRWGIYESAKEYVGWPITPGFEFSGKVVQLGEGTSRLQVGDLVFGITRFDAYSTHVVVPEHQVFKKPNHLSLEEAGAFPVMFMTAFHALFQNIIIRPHSKLLVHSAAGGVGSALVQLAKTIPCEVTGVVGATHKVEAVKQCGADYVIDKSTQDLWGEAEKAAPDGYDVILDANGYATLRESYRHLRPTGKLVSYGFHSMLPKKGGKINYPKLALNFLRTPKFNPIFMTNENKSLITFNLSFLFERLDLISEGMNGLIQLAEKHQIKPIATRVFAMKDVGKAHCEIESGMSVGKLVLDTRDC